MPRYYFDVRDKSGSTPDKQGMEFETLEQAILEARKALHEIAAEDRVPESSAVSIDIREGETSLITVMASTSIVPSLNNAAPRKGPDERTH